MSFNIFIKNKKYDNTNKAIISKQAYNNLNILIEESKSKNTYVIITITNEQASATPANFQQMININSSNYTSNEADDLSNIYFSTDIEGENIVNSWLESGNSNISNSTIYYIKLVNSINANSSIKIYMQFDSLTTNRYNNTTTGLAPQLSRNYGEYDNGENVFKFYDNFAGTTLNTSKWTLINDNSSFDINNSITFWSGTNTKIGLVYATPQNPSNIIIETTLNIVGTPTGDTSTALLGSWALGTELGSAWGGIGLFGDTGSPEYYGGAFSGIYVPMGSSSTDYNLFEQWTFSSSGTFTWTSYVNKGGSPGAINFQASTTFTLADFTSFYSSFAKAALHIQWTRIRIYPPNGVIPNVSVSSIING